MHYPDEERGAARPLKTTPCYSRMKELGAVFGSVYGWERPNWFAPKGYEVKPEDNPRPDVLMNDNHAPVKNGEPVQELWSFRRSNYFEHVGNECKHVMNKVGLLDMSAFAKIQVDGVGARDWLNSIFANKVPKTKGRIALSHCLTIHGGVRSEFTVYEHKANSFYLVSAGAFERHDHDVLRKLLPADGSVRLTHITDKFGVLVLAGPRSRDVLQKLTDTPLDNDNFKWLSGKAISIGHASCHALRVNFVGELGWEIHHPIEMQNAIFDLLMEAGAEFDIKPFGIRAMDSLRLEKSYRLIPREMSIEYSAFESGLQRFVRKDDTDFLGKAGLEAAESKGRRWDFVTLEVHGIEDADARGSEAIYDMNGALIGRATSGGYGWRVEKSLALAMVRPEYKEIGTQMQIKILGKMYKATVIEESPYDSENAKLRA